MRKNWIIIFLIFAIPMGVYGYLEMCANAKSTPKVSTINNAVKVYKFSSPMCSDCVEVENYIKDIKGNYPEVVFEEITVTGTDGKKNKALIEKYNVKVVPTLVFINKSGDVYEIIEADIKKEDITKNLKVLTGR